MTTNEPISESTEQLSTPEEQSFDYTIFSPSTRIYVQQHTNDIKNLLRRNAQDIINIGQKLLEVKEQLGHGFFDAWLKAEFSWGQWTARKFMQVARQFKSVNFTDLSIDVSALYFLAAPSTPEAIRQKALELAEQGEVITYARVKVIAHRYRESAESLAFKPTKSSTIDIPVQTVEWGRCTPTESPLAAQIPNAKSVVVEQSEDKLLKKTEALAQFQVSNRSHDITSATDSDDYPSKDQAEINIQQLLFGVGNLICITEFSQQDHKCFGKVTEVKKVTATEVEVVIKISLPS